MSLFLAWKNTVTKLNAAAGADSMPSCSLLIWNVSKITKPPEPGNPGWKFHHNKLPSMCTLGPGKQAVLLIILIPWFILSLVFSPKEAGFYSITVWTREYFPTQLSGVSSQWNKKDYSSCSSLSRMEIVQMNFSSIKSANGIRYSIPWPPMQNID